MNNFLSWCILVLMSSSCTISGLFSDYKKVDKEYPELLKKVSDKSMICDMEYSDSCQVLVLNGKELLPCLAASEKALLYTWSPHCSSPYCYGLDRVQAYCTEKGIQLYVVADYYDAALMKAYYMLDFPIVGINVKDYKNNLVPVYNKKFLEDLSIITDKNNSDRLFYLEKGKYIRSFRALEEVQ